jgi:S1-C subfamily serine protease
MPLTIVAAQVLSEVARSTRMAACSMAIARVRILSHVMSESRTLNIYCLRFVKANTNWCELRSPTAERKRTMRLNSRAHAIVLAVVLLSCGAALSHVAQFEVSTPIYAHQPAATLPRDDQAAIDTFSKVGPAVVQVVSIGVGSGSGVIFDRAGDIVTNNHVVEGAVRLSVNLSDGRILSARLIGRDPADDLAVIRVHAARLPVASFGDSTALHPAQTVLAIGNPLGLQQTVTEGVVSAIGRTVDEPPQAGKSGNYLPDAIQTSAPINPGNSGGALVTLDGLVVGIPTLEVVDTGEGTSAQGIGFAVSSARVKLVVPQLIRSGKVTHTGRAYLAVGLEDAQGNGARVTTLAAGGPADVAGVQVDDVIAQVDGRPVATADDVRAALARHKPGDRIRLVVDRNGQAVHLVVVVGELPATQ